MRSLAPALMPIFRSRHQAELLAWLLLHPAQEYTLSELAERLDVPLPTLHRESRRLVESGLLLDRVVGRARLLRADPRNPATEPLTRLLEVTFGPRPVIAEEFALPGVQRVLIFGSWADRYNGNAGAPPHDVDVLVVGEVDRSVLYEAADRAQARLGIQVNPVLRTAEQWSDDSDPLVAQIKKSPVVEVLSAEGSDT